MHVAQCIHICDLGTTTEVKGVGKNVAQCRHNRDPRAFTEVKGVECRDVANCRHVCDIGATTEVTGVEVWMLLSAETTEVSVAYM